MLPLLRHARYVLSGNPVTGLAFGLFALFPGAALMAAVFCFNLLGDGLRDIIDPLKRT